MFFTYNVNKVLFKYLMFYNVISIKQDFLREENKLNEQIF